MVIPSLIIKLDTEDAEAHLNKVLKICCKSIDWRNFDLLINYRR